MQHLSRRFTIFAVLVTVGGGVALQSVRSSTPSGGAAPTEAEATATVGEDGAVAVTGVTLPGQSVALPAECADAANQTARVVCAANAFLATLSETRRTEVALDATAANATVWSNLPVDLVARNGLALSTLTDAQQDAALAVVLAATGSAQDDGYSEVTQLLMADDVLNASGAAAPRPAAGLTASRRPVHPPAAWGRDLAGLVALADFLVAPWNTRAALTTWLF